MAMSQKLKRFTTSVNFQVMLALKEGVPVLEIISALEGMAAEMDETIERTVAKAGKKGDPDAAV